MILYDLLRRLKSFHFNEPLISARELSPFSTIEISLYIIHSVWEFKSECHWLDLYVYEWEWSFILFLFYFKTTHSFVLKFCITLEQYYPERMRL